MSDLDCESTERSYIKKREVYAAGFGRRGKSGDLRAGARAHNGEDGGEKVSVRGRRDTRSRHERNGWEDMHVVQNVASLL